MQYTSGITFEALFTATARNGVAEAAEDAGPAFAEESGAVLIVRR